MTTRQTHLLTEIKRIQTIRRENYAGQDEPKDPVSEGVCMAVLAALKEELESFQNAPILPQ
jgi:hypothetical protein